MTNKIGLYIHIPFCPSICSYCDFNKLQTNNSIYFDRYASILIDEIKNTKKKYPKFDTIYIGGGTPNALPFDLLNHILKELNFYNPVEFTIELNPELIDDNLISILKESKVNRISLGIQTFSNKGLKILNRKHTKEKIFNVYPKILNITSNVSIDMILNYPTQTFKMFKKDLKILFKLNPSHFSYYDLILEDHTKITYLINKGKLPKPDSDNSYKFLNHLIKKSKKKNYNHYELSSFAKENKESVHNILYWEMDEYVGLGLGAVSFINNQEFKNSNNFQKYIKGNNQQEIDNLNKDALIKRTFLTGLRKINGINLEEIEQKYKMNSFDYFPELKELINDGLLEIKDNNLKLTNKGLFLGNIVFEVFV